MALYLPENRMASGVFCISSAAISVLTEHKRGTLSQKKAGMRHLSRKLLPTLMPGLFTGMWVHA